MLLYRNMTEGREPEAVVYPSAPLRAVAIEVTFPSLLDAISRFGAFQRRHTAEFDRLYETSGDEDVLPDGREFGRPRSTVLMGRGPEPERAVSIARDQLAVITYTYAMGFNGFASWGMPMLLEGLRDLSVDRIATVSYRYENRIPHDTRDRTACLQSHPKSAAKRSHEESDSPRCAASLWSCSFWACVTRTRRKRTSLAGSLARFFGVIADDCTTSDAMCQLAENSGRIS